MLPRSSTRVLFRAGVYPDLYSRICKTHEKTVHLYTKNDAIYLIISVHCRYCIYLYMNV